MDRWVRVSQFFVPLVALASACAPARQMDEVRPDGPMSTEAPAEVDVAEVSAEIRALLRTSVQAWNRGDLDAFLAAYSDQPSLHYVRGDSVFTGKRALRDRVAGVFAPSAGEPDDMSFDEVEVSILGPDHALVVGRWTTFQPGFDVQTVTGQGRFSMIVRREALGWRISHEHAS